MTFMVLLSAFALSLLCGLALSIPLPDNNSTTLPVASSADPFFPVTRDLALGTALAAVNTLLLAPAQMIVGLPLPDRLTTADDASSLYLYPSQSPLSSTAALVTTTATEVLTDTETLTEPPTTITASASTVTDVVTVFIPISPPPPSSTTTAPRPSGAKAAWAAPAQMTDLSAFNISAFPGGQQNLQLVTGIPATASASSSAFLGLIQPFSAPAPYMPWDNASTVMQLVYPEDSSNPAGKPQGGAEFYATPLVLAPAQSVTMGYSVFFPDDFDWVKAGKLPGLFGGRMACSGGDAALDCFSTRLMWRQNGAGELYLYAAKDKQTAALCADPQSVCDSKYGLSIGRGAFKWRAGGWTTVSQTVLLNTPGKQDGGFRLYVDGQQVIHRDDVFYRDVPSASTTKAKAPPKTTSTSTSDPDDGDGGDLLPLGPLLSGLLDRRTVVQEVPRDARPLLLPVPTASGQEDLRFASDVPEWAVQLTSEDSIATSTVTTTPGAVTTTTTTSFATVTLYPTLVPGSEQAAPRTVPIGFIGIFFSTFFGGHGPAYATPRDQYVWFKDFDVVFNR